MINSKIIEEAVYDLCVQANTVLSDDVFAAILDAYNSEENCEAKQALGLILKNAKLSFETQKPLCQDTGQVLAFVKIGNASQPKSLYKSINNAVSKAYEENFYRKSVVQNSIFNRLNTKNNTPCIIYSEIVDGDELEIEILIKGAGAENMSVIEMLSPISTESEIVDFVKRTIEKSGAKACPPLFIGVGIGGTMEYAGILSKKALSLGQSVDEKHKHLAEKMKAAINELNIGVGGLGGKHTALGVKVLTDFTHIACMPVAVTINCHSSRYAKCKIKENELTFYPQKLIRNYEPPKEDFSDFVEVNTSDVEKLKSLERGQKVLLSGEIYTARDMAHKRLIEMIEKGETLPFDLKDKVIFYAGPCPAANDSCDDFGCSEKVSVVGSIGPTTASRMDKFAPILYKNGVLATIGKGERSEEVEKIISKVGGLYFSALGGIACYLSEKFIKKELVAFEDLGTEAIYKFEVRDFPLRLCLN